MPSDPPRLSRASEIGPAGSDRPLAGSTVRTMPAWWASTARMPAAASRNVLVEMRRSVLLASDSCAVILAGTRITAHERAAPDLRGRTYRAGSTATGSRWASWWLAFFGVASTAFVWSSSSESDSAPLPARTVSSASSQCS